MTDRELAEAMDGVRFVLSSLELVLRSLDKGPDVGAVIEDLVRAARILTPIIRTCPPPSLAELGFSEIPLDPPFVN